MREWLFISDTHLTPDRPDVIRLFVRFVDEVAIHADRLYILGDFLEYWLGDDDSAEGLEPVFQALKMLDNGGVNVFFMAGNRDFLVGHALADKCGFSIIEEPYMLEINGKKTLLLHGDTLCTDDIEYQKFRTMVRNRKWQQQILARPLREREQLAHSMRQQSEQANAEKDYQIMDVNQDSVIQTMKKYSVQLLIHGHTHRPAIHDFNINGQPAKRIVLSDWHNKGSYVKINESSEPELVEFS
ncbi:MAG: UDP-2,3-diacylglucosamine diphosphatase [Gammaproteobacteria bacterium]|nr:UDP-2,3-diacylglucosamine diphosphatase [Gammaproteobacteria bacterium]